MTSLGASGHGTTASFGTSGWSENIRFIGGLERLRAWLSDSHLGLAANAENTMVPADLITLSPWTIRYQFNQSSSTFPPITGAPETVTLTFPLKSGESTNATLVMSGGLAGDKGPDIEVNATTTTEGELTFQPDGKTGPTYTAGS